MAYSDTIYNWTDDEGVRNWSNQDPREKDRIKAFDNIVTDVRNKRQAGTPGQQTPDPSYIDPEKAYQEWLEEPAYSHLPENIPTSELDMENPEHRKFVTKKNKENRSEFTRGLLSGIDETQGMLYGAAGLVGGVTGVDKLRDWGFENYKRNMKEAELNPVSIGRIEDIDSIGDAADWFAGTIGKLAPTMGEIAAASAIGAFAGGGINPASGVAAAFNRGLIKKYVKKKMRDVLESKSMKAFAKEYGEDVATKAAMKQVGRQIGGNVGLMIGSSALEAGGMYADEVEKHGQEGANAWSSLSFGLLSGASELVTPGAGLIRKALGLKSAVKGMTKAEASKILKKAGTKEFVARMLKATPGAMGKEAVQEFVQEFLGTLNSYVNDPAAGLLTEENLSQYANAAAAGAAAGFLFGGLEGASSYRADKAEAQGAVEEVAEEEAEEDPFADIPEAEAEEVLNNAWEGAEKLSGEIKPLSEEDEKKERKAILAKRIANLRGFKKPTPKQVEKMQEYQAEMAELEGEKKGPAPVPGQKQKTLGEAVEEQKFKQRGISPDEYAEIEAEYEASKLAEDAAQPFFDTAQQGTEALKSSISDMGQIEDPQEARENIATTLEDVYANINHQKEELQGLIAQMTDKGQAGEVAQNIENEVQIFEQNIERQVVGVEPDNIESVRKQIDQSYQSFVQGINNQIGTLKDDTTSESTEEFAAKGQKEQAEADTRQGSPEKAVSQEGGPGAETETVEGDTEQAVTSEKQPWEMSLLEYGKSKLPASQAEQITDAKQVKSYAAQHKREIQAAVDRKEDVPAKVLKEYPDLEQKGTSKSPITKDDITIEGVDRDTLSGKEWESILGFANTGYQNDKRKTYKKSGKFILKDEAGQDTDTTYTWSVEKAQDQAQGSFQQGQVVTWKNKKGRELTGTLKKKLGKNWYVTLENGKNTLTPENRLTIPSPGPDSVVSEQKKDVPVQPVEGKPVSGKDKRIGVSPEGEAVYKDKRGARYYIEDGYKITQPVRIARGGEVEVDSAEVLYHKNRTQFLTNEEIKEIEDRTQDRDDSAGDESTSTQKQAVKKAGSLKEQLKAEWAKQAKERQEKEEQEKKPSTGMSPELAYRKEYQHWVENGRQGEAPGVPAHLEPHALENIQKSVEANLKPAEAREYKEDMAKAAKDAKESASKMMDALKNVNKILGERGSFSTEETDENTYKLISEQLNIAWKHAQDAGKSVAEFVTIAMEALTHKATPYFNRWVDESIDETQESPAAKISDQVKDRLRSNRKITSRMLFQWADDAYGGTQGEGVYSVKDAYDALELGVNKHLAYLSEVFDPSMTRADVARSGVQALTEINQLIPTQTKRTQEQQDYQQFSTPPALAFVANWVANPTEKDVVLEPSAGIGGLAVFAKNARARVYVNELSDRRAKMLSELGFDGIYQEDALQIDNILPESIKPTVVIMNPPFSATAGRLKNNKTKYGAQHIEQSLSRLEPGGRLVAIVGKGMGLDAPTFTEWWDKIRGQYNVRANVAVDGKEYAKYGTTFDNRLIVIDKAGKTDKIITEGKDIVGSYKELIDILKPLKEDRENAQTAEDKGHEQTLPIEQGGSESPAETQDTTAGSHPTLRTTDEVGDRERDSVKDGDTGKDDIRSGDTFTPEKTLEGTGERDTTAKNAPGGPEGTGADVDTGPGSVDSGSRPQLLGREKDVRVKKEFTASIYDEYEPSVTFSDAKKHITPLVESAAMADTKPPKISYTPKIPQKTIETGELTDAQLEAVVFAGNAHEKKLPSGERKGYFIGDGTGVGKGREISGIIWDNWNRGRKKAIWLSEKGSLLKDAQRDLQGVGWDAGAEKVFSLNKTKTGKPITAESGILFSSYDTLRSGFEAVRTDIAESLEDLTVRVNQVAKWAGKDFDGVIAFDESHNMGNAIPVKKTRGYSKPARKALAGLLLQELLPNARVVYVSATGATEVQNLAYAPRLGLWGEGTPFRNVVDFITQISGSGLSAMELVARDMKSLGSYLARSLSYAEVKYDRLEHPLSDEQTKIYDTMAEGWQTVLKNINDAIEQTGGGNGQRAVALSQFWGAHQRFFNQVVTSMQMPSALKQMEKDLKAGNAVVIQLVNTNAAQQERKIEAMSEDMSIEDIDMTPRETLMEYIDRSFPVQQYEEYTDENGAVKTRPVYDSNDNPVINRQAQQMKEQLMERVGSMSVPSTAIDMIFEKFGVDKVAEITGRKRRIVKDPKTGEKIIQKWSDAKSKKDILDFMDDKKQILIFSEKGGTGASYHADLSQKNQRLRRHYLVQPGWRADKAVQGLGRSHRSNQRQAPEFVLVTTDLPGQKRFLSSIARRLDQLGALTKGQRQSGSQGLFAARDNLESPYAKDALARFFRSLTSEEYEDVSAEQFEQQTGIVLFDDDGNLKDTPPVTQFLNRILSMTKSMQESVFNHFSDALDQVVEEYDARGMLDVGLETVTADHIRKISEQTIYKDEKENIATKHVKFELDRPTQKVMFKDLPSSHDRYYTNKKSGKIRAASQPRERTNTDTGVIEKYVVLMNPRKNMERVSVQDLSKKWEEVSKEDAKAIWETEYKEISKYKTTEMHLLTGTLLPLWDRIQGKMGVARLQTDDGERFLGRRVPEDEVNKVLKNFGVGLENVSMTPAQVNDYVKSGGTVVFHDGSTLKRSKVSGENRIEFKANAVDPDVLRRYGLFSEMIQWKTRWFVPIDNVQALENLIEYKDIVERRGGEPVKETKADQFEKAYDKVSASGRSAYVYQIKDELDWTEDEVNAFIEKQMVEGALAGLPGDPSKLTQEQRDRSFHGSDGEQYIAVSKRRELVDTEDAQYSITSTTPWAEGFPPIYGHTNTATLKKQPGYNAAKAGELQAAAETVSAVVKPERIKPLGEQYPNAMVVAVHSEEETGRNKLPTALANAIASATGLQVNSSIVQSRRAEHSKKSAAQRILSRAEYDGEVVKGQEYILVDDVVTAGGTLSELRHYIENNGGKVVAISSLSYARGSGNLALQTETLNNLKKRFDQNELETLLQEYNVSGNLEAITESEGRYLLKFKTVDAIRNKFSQERSEGSEQVLYSLLQRESADLKSIPPASALSSSEIQGLFKKQKVIIQDNGEISVQFKNGHGLVIESVERVSDKDYELAYRSGQMDKDGIIAGRHTPGRIQIAEGIANYATLVHELEHELESSGIFQKTDINLLDSHAKKLIRQGKIKKNKIAAENRANALGYIIDNRKQYRGTRLGWIAQKVMDFIDAILHIGRASMRKLAREIESGDIYSRQPGGEGGQAAPMFEAAPKVGTRAFKNWFKDSKVVDKNGKPLVVYHGTAAKFTAFEKKKTAAMVDRMLGFHLAVDPEVSNTFTKSSIGEDLPGGNVKPVYISANPKKISQPKNKTGERLWDEDAVTAEIAQTVFPKHKDLFDKWFIRRTQTDQKTADQKYKELQENNNFGQFTADLDAGLFLMKKSDKEALVEKYKEILKRQGYNAIQYYNTSNTETKKAQDRTAYIVFEPTQIKSVYNKGTFDPYNPDIRYSKTAPRWYSALVKGIEGLKQEKAPGKQWLGMINNLTNVKDEEIDWVGLKPWLEQKEGKVTKQEILDFVAANNIEIQEVEKAYSKAKFIVTDEKTGREIVTESKEAAKIEGEKMVEEKIKDDLPNFIIKKEGKQWFAYRNGMEWLSVTDGAKTKAKAETLLKEYLEEFHRADIWYEHKPQGRADVKYAKYQEPGGSNYREILLTMPVDNTERKAHEKKLQEYESQIADKYNVPMAQMAWDKMTDAEKAEMNRLQEGYPAGSPVYHTTHYDEPNILAHVRINEREVNGERVLFLEEVQSDLHRAGKDKGYKGDTNRTEIAKEYLESLPAKARPIAEKMLNTNESLTSGRFDQEWADLDRIAPGVDHNVIHDTRDIAEQRERDAIINAPFKKSWRLLAIKRMVRYAAENGFNRIAWTSGRMQAERYDLSKQVEEIRYTRPDQDHIRMSVESHTGDIIISNEQLYTVAEAEGVVGKEIVQKMQKGEGQKKGEGETVLSGLDLKVGGEKLKELYDKIIPSEVKGFFGKKTWGNPKIEMVDIGGVAKPYIVEPDYDNTGTTITSYDVIEIHSGKGVETFSEKKLADKHAEELNKKANESRSTQVLSIEITQKMKQKALHEGMPMFQTVRRTDTPAFKKWFGKSKATNKKGQPITFYHGTPETFTVFQDQAGKSTKHGSSGLGHFFSGSLQSAKHYAGQGGNVIKGYLRMEKPYKMTLKEAQSFVTVEESTKRRRQLENKGYDSIVLIVPGGNPVFIVFKPNQVKSVQNTGLWSTTDDDINYNLNQETAVKDFKDLQSKVSKDSLMQELEPAAEEVLTQQQKAVRSLFKQVFGRDVLYFDSQDTRAKKINGFTLALDPSKVFINTAPNKKGARPPLFVAAHETMHTIEVENPQLYRWVEKQLQAYIKMEGFENFLQEKSYYEQIGKDPGREFLPEMFAEAVNNPKFWDYLFAQDKTKLERLVNYLLQMIKKIKSWARKEGMEHYFTDVDATLKIMADAVKRMDSTAPGLKNQIEREISTKPGENIQFDIASSFSEKEEIDSYKNVLNGLKGVWRNRADKGPGDLQDIGVLENSLSLISHYSDKVTGLKMTFDELLRRPEWKYMTENRLSKDGDVSLPGVIIDLQKNNKAAYKKLNKYLLQRDVYQVGNQVKDNKDGTFSVLGEEEANGERMLLSEGFTSKRDAMKWSIDDEVSRYPSQAGREALKAFRTIVLNLHDYYSETWNEIARNYEERGLVPPPVVVRTSSGETRISLKTALAKMGDRSTYYFPRLRSNGGWQVFATKVGTRSFMDFRDTRRGADYLMGKLQAQGYITEKKKVGGFSEDLFSDIRNVLSTQVMVNQALAETKLSTKQRDITELGIQAYWDGADYVVENGGEFHWSSDVLSQLGGEVYDKKTYKGNRAYFTPGYVFRGAREEIEEIVLDSLLLARGTDKDITGEFAQSLADQLSDEIKGRGSRARMIARSDAKGEEVISGYEEDAIKAISKTISAAAGGEAKKQVALRTSRAITGRHLSWKEFVEQHPDGEKLDTLEAQRDALNDNTPEEKKEIDKLQQRVTALQQERVGVKVESEESRQKRLQEIRSLYNDMKQMRKWIDAEEAARLKQEMAVIRQGLHKDYKSFIAENMIHPKKQPRALEDAMSAVEHVLKNDEAADRAINTLKGLASVWFLGGRVSSAAINLTAMGTSVPASMKANGDIPLRKTPQLIAKASKTYMSYATGKGQVSKADRAILEEIDSRGWVAAQLNMETMNAMKSGPAKGYSRVAEILMTPFKVTEEFNRAVTILAAYKGVKANSPGISTDKALRKAKTISDRAHGIYGKENDPALLRKGRGLRAFSTMYIFQRFFHNYLATLSQMIGRRQAKAAATMLLSPVVFGGAGSTLAMPIIKAIAKTLDMDDPEDDIYKTAQNIFGEKGENIARYGIPGLAGVSLKGSLAPNLPDFAEPIDILGPIGGMARNIWEGGKNITQGNTLRGIEGLTPTFAGNIVKGYRETTQGVTTRAGAPVFFGNEPVTGNMQTGLLRAGGFNPIKIAKPREIQWDETTTRMQYANKKRDLYSKIIRYYAKGKDKDPAEWESIIYDIRKLNARIKSNEIERFVPLITSKSIKARIRRAFRPAKRERLR